jgi:hypothetical protein
MNVRSIIRISLIQIVNVVVFSCNTIETVNLPENQPKLVVNCIGQNTRLINTDFDIPFISDSLWTAYVSLSNGILQPQTLINQVSDATVNLYENGNFLETMSPYVNPRFQGVYKSKSNYPTPGNAYQIEVIRSPYTSISASYTQPSAIVVDSIEFKIIGPDPFYQGTTDIQVRVRFSDPADEDYYELSLTAKSDVDTSNGYSISNGATFGMSFIDPAYLKTNGIQLPSGSVVFSDSFFNGKEATLDFLVMRIEDSTLPPLKYYTIQLNHISKEYYLYLKTYLLQKQTEGDPFAQPVMVENNIQNGFGIFCGLTSTTKTVVFEK